MIDEIMNSEIKRLTNDNKPSQPQLRKVEGRVTNPKISPWKKFTDEFFEEDLGTIVTSLRSDIVIPRIKDFFVDLLVGGVERAFYGESRRGSRPGSYGGSSLVRAFSRSSLDGYYTDYAGGSKGKKEPLPKKKFTFEDVVMRDRPSAQDLLDNLRQAIRDYGQVSVAQLYESIYDDDMPVMDFANNYYGWKSLDDARVTRVQSGYWVNLPRPIQLD